MSEALRATLRNLEAAVRDTLSEDEVEHLFDALYAELGYITAGRDILRKRGGKSGIPDVRLQNSDESIQVVVELKRPSEDLTDHQDQITRYLHDLKAPYGILSNGRELWLYQRHGQAISPPKRYTLTALADNPSPLEPLTRQILDPLDFAQVQSRFTQAKEEGLSLTQVDSLQAEQFLSAFALEPESPFGDLVQASLELLNALLEQSDFTAGAYDFWRKVYARQLDGDKVPKVWRAFPLDSTKESVNRFMYVLESAYSLTARLILAKVIQDHDRHGRISTEPIADRFLAHLNAAKEGRAGRLPPSAYLEAAEALFNGYAKTLFTSIYAQDVFDWWRDYPRAQDAQDRFALAVARLVLSLVRFDFAELQGDLLGELYQTYFDPETRKALGEFYTPPEVVDFILDEVGYDGRGRLLDPATGSGTFLIRALRRYLDANRGRDPAEVLSGITREFNIVAFDVNPFAVLMAQVNVAAHLVPLYAEAIERNPDFVVHNLPIVRTDSLRQEVIEGERREGSAKHGSQGMSQEIGISFGSEEIRATIALPVKTESGPLEVSLTFPNLEAAKATGHIRNEREWLLAVQAVFTAVEVLSQAYDADRTLPELRATLRGELALYNPSPDKLADYLKPSAEGVWKTLQTLKQEHGDGRFLETLQDLMLGLILKHYMKYDYVVGNPPYVRIQNIPELQKKYWSDKYVWAKGNYDIFIPFIERVLYGERPWLKEGGRLGYIAPNRFLNANYATELRRNLPRAAKVKSLTDFKAVTFAPSEEDQATRLFKEAMVYPAILIVEKGSPKGESYTFKAARFYPHQAPLHPKDAIRALNTTYSSLKDSAHVRLTSGNVEYADAFTQESGVLEEKGWFVMPAEERGVFDKLEHIGNSKDGMLPVTDKATSQQRRLENYTATKSGGFQGVATGLDSVMVLKQLDEKTEGEASLLYVRPRGNGGAFWIEKDAPRSFLFGKDVERWYVGWEGWWVIFPYFRHSGRYWLMPSTEYWEFTVKTHNGARRVFEHWPDSSPFIDKAYPKLWAYLKQHEKDMRGRENGRYKVKKSDEWRWYDLARPQNISAAERPKIVAQLLARSAQFAFDAEGGVHFQAGGKGGGVYGLLFNAGIDDHFAMSLLNSRTLDFHLKQISSVYSNGYFSYADAFLKGLPIASANPETERNISALAHLLTDKTARLRALEKQVETFPASLTVERRGAGTVPELDEVARLAVAGGLPKMIDASDVREQSDLQGQTVLAVGRGEVRAAPMLARLLRRVLDVRGKVKREELLGLELPMGESDQQDYLEQLAGWEGEVEELKRAICQGELELNTLVYDLYDLGAEDREVLEGFLARF